MAHADKSKKPDKPRKYQRPPRRKNRFNEREVARAGRAGKAIGAESIPQPARFPSSSPPRGARRSTRMTS